MYGSLWWIRVLGFGETAAIHRVSQRGSERASERARELSDRVRSWGV